MWQNWIDLSHVKSDTLPRDDDSSRTKGWIRGNTMIGLVLKGTINYHQSWYGIEIRIVSLPDDGSQSWVMISTGLNMYVTEMPDHKPDDEQENRDDTSGVSAGRLDAEARPKQTSLSTSSSQGNQVPLHGREWVDVEPGKYDHHSFVVAKRMNRYLRHDTTIPREEDGAIEFRNLAPMFVAQFESSPQWSRRTRLNSLRRGGGVKKRFEYCLDPNSRETVLYLGAIRGHSGESNIDPTVQDNVILPSDFAEHIYHVGSSHDLHSITLSRLVAGGKDVKKRQTDSIIQSR